MELTEKIKEIEKHLNNTSRVFLQGAIDSINESSIRQKIIETCEKYQNPKSLEVITEAIYYTTHVEEGHVTVEVCNALSESSEGEFVARILKKINDNTNILTTAYNLRYAAAAISSYSSAPLSGVVNRCMMRAAVNTEKDKYATIKLSRFLLVKELKEFLNLQKNREDYLDFTLSITTAISKAAQADNRSEAKKHMTPMFNKYLESSDASEMTETVLNLGYTGTTFRKEFEESLDAVKTSLRLYRGKNLDLKKWKQELLRDFDK